MAKILMKNGIKCSIYTGAVYYTLDQGLWQDTDKADQVYSQIYKAVAPYVSEVPVEIPELPSTEDVVQCSRYFYNRGVIASVGVIKELPQTVRSWGVSLKSSISNLLEASGEAPSSNSDPKPA